ncbi:hypothetical protein KCU90_g2364, partial [Aureobasidium melanogenum]
MVDAATNRGKRNAGAMRLMRHFERALVAGGEKVGLAMRAAAPHRADCVNHMFGRQTVAAGDLRVAGRAAVERFALTQQLLAGGAVNRAIHATAP